VTASPDDRIQTVGEPTSSPTRGGGATLGGRTRPTAMAPSEHNITGNTRDTPKGVNQPERAVPPASRSAVRPRACRARLRPGSRRLGLLINVY
jgi:hypothetical protein